LGAPKVTIVPGIVFVASAVCYSMMTYVSLASHRMYLGPRDRYRVCVPTCT